MGFQPIVSSTLSKGLVNSWLTLIDLLRKAGILVMGSSNEKMGDYSQMTPWDPTTESILVRFGDIEHHPNETLAPYEEFSVAAKTYSVTPGGFLYRKDPGSEEVGGFFCGYLSDWAWRYRTAAA